MRMQKINIEIDVIGLSDLGNSCKEFSYGEGDWPLRDLLLIIIKIFLPIIIDARMLDINLIASPL